MVQIEYSTVVVEKVYGYVSTYSDVFFRISIQSIFKEEEKSIFEILED